MASSRLVVKMQDAKKELGQHWLQDQTILDAIVSAAEIAPDDNVLEIGPGHGSLTEKLVEAGARLTALEFDRDLLAELRRKFKNSNAAIEHGDIRKFDFRRMTLPYKIVANIPYYLTSHLIRSISETENPPIRAVLLIQKEVAERLCAKPGEMSILAVTAQFYFDCQLDCVVPAHYFSPPPKVDSQAVVLKRRAKLPFDVNEAKFFRLVKAGFSEKRKTLRNALSGGLAISKESVEDMLNKAQVDSGLRAQALSLEAWYELYKVWM